MHAVSLMLDQLLSATCEKTACFNLAQYTVTFKLIKKFLPQSCKINDKMLYLYIQSTDYKKN